MAYYRPPAVDGSRPGAHCLLATDPTERFRFEYEALAFHESVPGHHLQLATAQTLDLPRYRRHLDVEACSFNEGWGLYAERARRGDGPLQRRPRAAGHAVLRRAARLPAGRRHRRARTWAGRGSRRSSSCGQHTATTRENVAQRGRPLHLLARPGAGLHDRQARDRPAARARPRATSATASTCAPSTASSSAAAPLPLARPRPDRRPLDRGRPNP